MTVHPDGRSPKGARERWFVGRVVHDAVTLTAWCWRDLADDPDAADIALDRVASLFADAWRKRGTS